MKNKIIISVIDGQGGGIGKQLIEKLSPHFAASENIIVRALGTNALATNAMLKAGADDGATGENAIVFNAAKSHIIAGVLPIVMPYSILGEVTPKMAEAIGASNALKVLIPLPKCSTVIAIPEPSSLSQYIDKAVEIIQEHVSDIE